MPVIDSQVHAYERDRPERPWVGTLAGPKEATGDQMVKAMDAVGVDGAILVSAYSMYRFDPSYALEVYKQHPNRFCLVKPVDVTRPDLAEDIAEWARLDGTVGVRVLLDRGGVDPAGDGVATALKAAAANGMPVNTLCWGDPSVAIPLAKAHPDTTFVIDHLGIKQPYQPPAPENAFQNLPTVLELAKFPNVTIKISGACTLAREPFPYPDIWDPVMRIIDAFGLDRCMWGTDWTRTSEVLTYKEGVEAFRQTDRLSDADREKLMGGTITKVYGWAPG